jgi:O-antigen/teichoic acid export membrane protein
MKLVDRNLTWLFLSQAATWVMTLVVMLVVPRLLGAENLGTYTYAAAYVGFFTLAAGLGTSTLMTREVARDYSIVP